MDDRTSNIQVTVIVPTIVRKEIKVLRFNIGRYDNDNMICDGCGNNMGSTNPKGVFKTNDGWFKLCNKCCIEQGFLTK